MKTSILVKMRKPTRIKTDEFEDGFIIIEERDYLIS